MYNSAERTSILFTWLVIKLKLLVWQVVLTSDCEKFGILSSAVPLVMDLTGGDMVIFSWCEMWTSAELPHTLDFQNSEVAINSIIHNWFCTDRQTLNCQLWILYWLILLLQSLHMHSAILYRMIKGHQSHVSQQITRCILNCHNSGFTY